MKKRMPLAFAASALALVGACTTSDNAVPADTATGQSTTVAPAGASAPVLSAPVDSVPAPSPTVSKAQTTGKTTAAVAKPTVPTTRPRATGSAPPEPLRDSAFKPRATVDEKGNIQPIKRDTLR